MNGEGSEAIGEVQRAVAIEPRSIDCRFNVGYLLESQGKFAEAVSPLEQAVAIRKGRNWRCLAERAKVYDKSVRPADALQIMRQALEAARQQNDQPGDKALQDMLSRFFPRKRKVPLAFEPRRGYRLLIRRRRPVGSLM